MGASQSSRKLTLVNDESAGVIKLSESLAHRLRGQIIDGQSNESSVQDVAPPEPVDIKPPEPIIESPEPIIDVKPNDFIDQTSETPLSGPIGDLVTGNTDSLFIPPPVVESANTAPPPPPPVEPPTVPDPTPFSAPAPVPAPTPPPPVIEEIIVEPELPIESPLSNTTTTVVEPSINLHTNNGNGNGNQNGNGNGNGGSWSLQAEEAHLALLRLREEKDEQIKNQEQQWRERLASREKEYMDHAQLTESNINSSIKKVESLFLKAHYEPVCPEIQEQVKNCFADNPKQLLKCSGLVQQFSQCVNASQMNAVKKDVAT